MRRSKSVKLNRAGFTVLAKPLFNGVATAMIFTVAAILVFAMILKLAEVPDSAIPAVNQILRILGICLAAFVTQKDVKDRKWLMCGVSGALYVFFGFIVFSVIEGSFSFDVALLTNLVMGFVVGMLFCLIFSRIPKKEKAGSRK